MKAFIKRALVFLLVLFIGYEIGVNYTTSGYRNLYETNIMQFRNPNTNEILTPSEALELYTDMTK